MNLGAGAELGIYTRLSVFGNKTDHWPVDTSLALTMTMTLNDNKENPIASYSPSDPQWWITSFNPYYQKMETCNLSVSFTVNFSGNIGMYDAFIKSDIFKYNKRWPISPDKKYTLILDF